MCELIFLIMGISMALGFFFGLMLFPIYLYALPYTEWLRRERMRGNIDWVWSDCIKSDIRKTLYHAKNATKWYWARLRRKPSNIKYY